MHVTYYAYSYQLSFMNLHTRIVLKNTAPWKHKGRVEILLLNKYEKFFTNFNLWNHVIKLLMCCGLNSVVQWICKCTPQAQTMSRNLVDGNVSTCIIRVKSFNYYYMNIRKCDMHNPAPTILFLCMFVARVPLWNSTWMQKELISNVSHYVRFYFSSQAYQSINQVFVCLATGQ
jgi:hypothetical protein